MLPRMTISEVLETLADAKQAPIYLSEEVLQAFAHKGLTAKQALSVQMRHYVMSTNGQNPTMEINAMVTKFRHQNTQKGV